VRKFEFYGEGIPGVDVHELTGWLVVIEGTDGVGRTTHVNLLREHLERQGYAVAETGLTRSDLASRGLRRAKMGNTLGSNAFNLYYATDFADRLEHQILPALRSGFVMLTDRYVYSLIARAIVRGSDPAWIKQVYSFSIRPDAVFYLRIGVQDLVPRVLQNGGFDYWESGMDIPMGDDLYDSFIRYQTRMVAELDGLAKEYGFETIDATLPIGDIAEHLNRRMDALLAEGRDGRGFDGDGTRPAPMPGPDLRRG
jgi:dTMP kinase